MNLPDELERLRSLRDDGTISDAEFEESKARLLQEPSEPQSVGTGLSAAVNNLTPNQWALLLHLSQFLGYAIPVAGFVVPILIWQFKKETVPDLDQHGKIVVNWLLSSLVYMVVSGLLTCVWIGFVGIIIVAVLAIVFPIIGALKANEGTIWPYPLTIKFFK